MADPGYAQLDRMVATLEGLGPKLVEETRPAIAKAMRAEVERTIQAQTDAYGEPWKPGEEGEPILESAASNLKTVIRGAKITLRLDGYHARHHRGYARGGVQRRILPTKGLMPAPMVAAVKRVLTKRFNEAMKGGA